MLFYRVLITQVCDENIVEEVELRRNQSERACDLVDKCYPYSEELNNNGKFFLAM